MGGVEGVGDLRGQRGCLPRVDGRALIEALAQRAAGQELHDDGLHVTLGARVEDRHDPWVGQPGCGHRLLSEAGDERRIGEQVRMQELDCDLAPQHLVGRLPHLCHASGRELRLEAIARGEQAAGRRRAGEGTVGAGLGRGRQGQRDDEALPWGPSPFGGLALARPVLLTRSRSLIAP